MKNGVGIRRRKIRTLFGMNVTVSKLIVKTITEKSLYYFCHGGMNNQIYKVNMKHMKIITTMSEESWIAKYLRLIKFG